MSTPSPRQPWPPGKRSQRSRPGTGEESTVLCGPRDLPFPGKQELRWCPGAAQWTSGLVEDHRDPSMK
ncbi:hypothetical protein AAFF_G00098810 [Aldrovandia affinis]|uniref:Uncharacterized protein n=1 Tax=Aldrovandia affinis TaxID=143900 RepID=A0AAD7RV47_9TELE|nr:hypothetical protein AAFF_G00098810 [Aldrovandia affinis]